MGNKVLYSRTINDNSDKDVNQEQVHQVLNILERYGLKANWIQEYMQYPMLWIDYRLVRDG